MPQTLTWNAAADVSAVGTSDGNNQAASAANPMLSQNRRSDTFGSTIDAGWTQSIGAGHSFNETGGQIVDAMTGTDNSAAARLVNLFTIPSGTALSFELLYSGFAGTVGADPEQFWVLVAASNGTGSTLGTKYVYAKRLVHFSQGNVVSAFRENGLGETQIGSNVAGGASGGFRVIQDGAGACEALYDVGSGYVSFGTGALDNDAYLPKLFIQGNSIDTADGCAVNFDAFNQLNGSVYWPSAVHTLVNKTFNQGNIDWSTFAATETGVVEYDYSTDGGTTYTGTYRTKAAMQALADQLATQLQIKVRFNGGNETTTATVDDITVNVVAVNPWDSKPGGLLHRVRWLR